MEIIRLNNIGNVSVPAIKIMPPDYRGIVLFIHGYGGCKEEMLGLGYRISESGFLSYTIDLRGHGENNLLFDENIVDDINHITACIREEGKKITIIGHSLGGRLTLTQYAIILSGYRRHLIKNIVNKRSQLLII